MESGIACERQGTYLSAKMAELRVTHCTGKTKSAILE